MTSSSAVVFQMKIISQLTASSKWNFPVKLHYCCSDLRENATLKSQLWWVVVLLKQMAGFFFGVVCCVDSFHYSFHFIATSIQMESNGESFRLWIDLAVHEHIMKTCCMPAFHLASHWPRWAVPIHQQLEQFQLSTNRSTGLQLAPPLNPNLPLAKGQVPTAFSVNQSNSEKFSSHSIS